MYRGARILGHIQAGRNGRVWHRIWNVLVGRAVARWVPWR